MTYHSQVNMHSLYLLDQQECIGVGFEGFSGSHGGIFGYVCLALATGKFLRILINSDRSDISVLSHLFELNQGRKDSFPLFVVQMLI